MTTLVLVASTALLVALTTPAAAQVVFNLTPSLQTAQAGTTATYTGLLYNAGTTSATVLGVSFSSALDDDPAAPDFADFEATLPDTLDAQQVYVGEVFTVALGTGVAVGGYSGTASVVYDEGGAVGVAQQGFLLDVEAPEGGDMPEPAACAFVAVGLVAMSLVFARIARGR